MNSILFPKRDSVLGLMPFVCLLFISSVYAREDQAVGRSDQKARTAIAQQKFRDNVKKKKADKIEKLYTKLQASPLNTISLSSEDAQKLVQAWDKIEAQLRAVREDADPNDPANPVEGSGCCDSGALDEILRCICIIKSLLKNLNSELLSIGDFLSSQIDDLDDDLLSIGDFLCSKIMEIDSINDIIEISIADVLSSKIMKVESDVSIVDSDLLSIGDFLCSKILDIDSVNDLIEISILEILSSKIMKVESDVSIVDVDVLSIGDFLCSKIVSIDSINDIIEISIADVLSSKIMDISSSSDTQVSIIDIISSKIMDLSDLIGTCTDTTIPEVTGASCIDITTIDTLCHSIISWLKTIVSELRGNQPQCFSVPCPPIGAGV